MKSRDLPLCILLIILGSYTTYAELPGHPPRLDIGFIMDMYIFPNAPAAEFSFAYMNQFLDRVSISPGTGRVAFLRISDKAVEEFGFKKHVNRECLLKSLEKIRQKYKGSHRGTVPSFLRALERIKLKKRPNAKSIIVTFLNNYNKPLQRYIRSKKDNLTELFNGFKVIFSGAAEHRKGINDLHLQSIINDVSSFLSNLTLPSDSLTSCSNKGFKTFDECKRHCDCIDGKKMNCFRIRKEFTAMPKKERVRYINAYRKLTSVEPYRSRYDHFVYMHYKYFCWGIHRKNLFFPWHRWYIVTMENLLREIDCRVTLPYWDWSYYGNDPWNATFNTLWGSGRDGLGQNGSIHDGFCVQTGAFSRHKWRMPFFNEPLFIIRETVMLDGLQIDPNLVSVDLANCLRRAMFGYLPGKENVLLTIAYFPPEKFSEFELYVRTNYHDRIHNQLGGTMCTHFAAAAPEFFFHHAFLDKIWFLWQKKGEQYKFAYFMNMTTKMIGSPYPPFKYVDSSDLPDCISVTYSKFPSNNRWKKDTVRRRRSVDNDEDYIDDNNRVPNNYWYGVLNTSLNDVFPKCGTNAKDKALAISLFKKIEHKLEEMDRIWLKKQKQKLKKGHHVKEH